MPADVPALEALMVLDVVSDFDHEDGDRLHASLRARLGALEAALAHARAHDVVVIYVNDARGRWDGDRRAHVARALAGPAGDVVRRVAPQEDDRFLFKAAHSGFDGTPLARLVEDLGVTRVVLAGAATEPCVAQTAITARERQIQITVLADARATIDPANEPSLSSTSSTSPAASSFSVEDWVADRSAARDGAQPPRARRWKAAPTTVRP